MALPFQVAPFPAAQPSAGSLRAGDRRGRCCWPTIRARPGPCGGSRGSSRPVPSGRLGLPAPRAFEPPLIAMAGAQADDRQHGHDPHEADRRLGGPPLCPAEEPLPAADRPGPDRLALEEIAQVVGQLAGRGVAQLRLPGHGLQADAVEVGGDPRIARSRARWARHGPGRGGPGCRVPARGSAPVRSSKSTTPRL